MAKPARPHTPRTVVVGGNTPFAITILDGSLLPGLEFDGVGVLSARLQAARFSFTV
jgi:hypothetical protein